MATPPQRVVSGTDIATSWGNSMVDFVLDSLTGKATRAGQVAYSTGTNEVGVLDPPTSGEGFYRMTAAGVPRWAPAIEEGDLDTALAGLINTGTTPLMVAHRRLPAVGATGTILLLIRGVGRDGSSDVALPTGSWTGLATTPTRIYVADDGNNRIRAFDYGGAEQTSESFAGPTALAGLAYSHADGRLYALSQGRANSIVQAHTLPGGAVFRTYSLGSGHSGATGITWNDEASLWGVAEPNSDRLSLWSSSFGSSGQWNLAAANADASGTASASGLFYVVDSADNHVYAYEAHGARSEADDVALAAGNSHPTGLSIENGVLYVLDTNDNKLYAYRVETTIDLFLSDGTVWQPTNPVSVILRGGGGGGGGGGSTRTLEQLQDAVAAMLVGNAEFTYNDANGTISFTPESPLPEYGGTADRSGTIHGAWAPDGLADFAEALFGTWAQVGNDDPIPLDKIPELDDSKIPATIARDSELPQPSNADPLPDGADAAQGTSTRYSRQDHVHEKDDDAGALSPTDVSIRIPTMADSPRAGRTSFNPAYVGTGITIPAASEAPYIAIKIGQLGGTSTASGTGSFSGAAARRAARLPAVRSLCLQTPSTA